MKMINFNGAWVLCNVVESEDVDAENCFTPKCPQELAVDGGDEIVPELNGQATLAYYRIGTKDAHPAGAQYFVNEAHAMFEAIHGAPDMDVYWNAHGVPGTFGFELIKGLPNIRIGYTFFVWKGIESNMHPYGTAYQTLDNQLSTGLIEYLDYEVGVRNGAMKTYAIIDGEKVLYPKKRVQVVIVGGLATDYCVKETVMQLLVADFKVILNLGACRGIDIEGSKKAVEEMKKVGKDNIMVVDSYLDIETKEAA